MALDYKPGLQPQAGVAGTAADPNDAQTPVKKVDHPVFAALGIAGDGTPTPAGTPADPISVNSNGGGTSATATKTQTTAVTTGTNGNILAANALRKGGTVFYDAGAILYLLEGAGVPSSTNYTTRLGAGMFTQYDVPTGFTGAISGAWSAVVGNSFNTERTA